MDLSSAMTTSTGLCWTCGMDSPPYHHAPATNASVTPDSHREPSHVAAVGRRRFLHHCQQLAASSRRWQTVRRDRRQRPLDDRTNRGGDIGPQIREVGGVARRWADWIASKAFPMTV